VQGIDSDITLNTGKGGRPLNRKSRLAAILAVAAVGLMVALPTAASAAFLSNWFVDVDGAGGAAKTQINQFLDIVGPTYVQNNLGLGTFTEFGAFKAVTHDGGQSLPGTAELTGIFTATGTISLGGSISFTGGTVTIYSDPGNDFGSTAGIYGANNGTLIGTFSIIPGGGGPIDTAGVPNGFITANLQAVGALNPNYWIAPDGVSGLSSLGLVLGFSTTNASLIFPLSNLGPNVQDEIGCQGLLGGVGCGSITDTPPIDLFLSANGQFRVAIPEPSSLMLLGGGLLMVALLGMGRKRV
jgi:hypothetical protein